jgi:hypothetical protein
VGQLYLDAVGQHYISGNIQAVLWRYRSGSAWRDLPERFDDFRKVHTRFMLCAGAARAALGTGDTVAVAD